MDHCKYCNDNDRQGLLDWGGSRKEGGEVRCEGCIQRAEDQQKFFGIDKDQKFQFQVLDFIQKSFHWTDGKEATVKDVVEHFTTTLGAKIFQHKVDIGIAVKYLIEDFLTSGAISMSTPEGEIVDFINLQPSETTYDELIVEGKGILLPS